MTENRFDFLAIGGGSGGIAAAVRSSSMAVWAEPA